MYTAEDLRYGGRLPKPFMENPNLEPYLITDKNKLKEYIRDRGGFLFGEIKDMLKEYDKTGRAEI